jgi:hypothetical protein
MMNKGEATEVGLKLLSMYAFLEGISALTLPISLRESQIALHSNTTFSPAAFIPSVLLFLFGIILWLNAETSEASALNDKSIEENIGGLTPQILQRIVFSALGILIVIQSIAPLGNVISAFARYFQDKYVTTSRFPYYRLIEVLVKLIFGSWLIIGSRSLKTFQAWLLSNIKKDW